MGIAFKFFCFFRIWVLILNLYYIRDKYSSQVLLKVSNYPFRRIYYGENDMELDGAMLITAFAPAHDKDTGLHFVHV